MTPSRAAMGGVICACVALAVVVLFRPHHPPAPVRRPPVPAPSPAALPPQPAAASSAIALPETVAGSSPAASAATAPARQYRTGQPALAPPERAELSTTDRPPLADRLGARNTKPAQEPRIVLDVLDAYRRSLGGYPAGEDNRQIVNALLGANEQNLPFIPSDHPRLNAGGEIVDAWGTPFFFHLESRVSIQVRSAGPDRALFTADDIVSGTPAPSNTHPMIPNQSRASQ